MFHLISKQDFVLVVGWNKSHSYERSEEKSWALKAQGKAGNKNGQGWKLTTIINNKRSRAFKHKFKNDHFNKWGVGRGDGPRGKNKLPY